MPPKSILKKSASAASSLHGKSLLPASASETRYTDRHRELALHHASLLQQRKDAELQILEAIEELLEFPCSTDNPATPSTADVVRLRQVLAPFSTHDYDDLIEERSLADKCGYALCPNPTPQKSAAIRSRFRLDLSHPGHVGKVSSSKPEVWCSKACAKRAMYIKVQLSEVPYWERLGGYGGDLDIMKEDDISEISRKMQEMDVATTEEQRLRQAMEDLALERGEKPDSARLKMVMTDTVMENTSVGAPHQQDQHAASPPASLAPGAIEGYTPRFVPSDNIQG